MPNITPPSSGKINMEQLHKDPNIYVLDDFLSRSDLEYLDKVIDTSTTKFKKSFVDDGVYKTTVDKSYRTSSFLTFAKQENANIAAIERKAANLLSYYSTGCIEPIQVVRYREGEFFGTHHDTGEYDETNKTVATPLKNCHSKRRIATIFCYLNDLEYDQGGATHFPLCGISIQPKKGRAVLWCNIKKDGSPDARTVHEGRAITDGVKYGLNIWILEE